MHQCQPNFCILQVLNAWVLLNIVSRIIVRECSSKVILKGELIFSNGSFYCFILPLQSLFDVEWNSLVWMTSCPYCFCLGYIENKANMLHVEPQLIPKKQTPLKWTNCSLISKPGWIDQMVKEKPLVYRSLKHLRKVFLPPWLLFTSSLKTYYLESISNHLVLKI